MSKMLKKIFRKRCPSCNEKMWYSTAPTQGWICDNCNPKFAKKYDNEKR